MSNQMRNVTPIGDLMDLETMDMPSPHHRAIRPSSKGMYQRGVAGGYTAEQMAAERAHQNREMQLPPGHRYPQHSGPQANESYNENAAGQYKVQLREHLRENLANEPNCMEIAKHVKNCPICTKFYDNDKTVYIIIIIVLAIICVLLLKRVLEL